MSLSKKQLTDYCQLHGGSGMCRYLDQDETDYTKWNCWKHRTLDKKKIDAKVDQRIADCLKLGLDPMQQGYPIGDNCSGYPLLRNIEQGYDVP